MKYDRNTIQDGYVTTHFSMYHDNKSLLPVKPVPKSLINMLVWLLMHDFNFQSRDFFSSY